MPILTKFFFNFLERQSQGTRLAISMIKTDHLLFDSLFKKKADIHSGGLGNS